ncbi:MAG: glycerol kinase GlpK [Sphingomicrobium sp.]
MGDTLLVIDEGTSSTRAMLVDAVGHSGAMAQRALATTYPRPGWVEQDAEEIWRLTLAAAREAVGDGAGRIAGIGLTNQRETIVFWDRKSGAALAPAIVWQDRRTADACAALRAAGHERQVQSTTGLLLDPYFSATKIGWALDHWPALRAAGDRLCVGTIESWLVFRLTGGLHVSDATNASRTQLMDLRGGWDDGLCALFGVPHGALPVITDCAGPIGMTLPEHFGHPILITGMAGDQQAAAIGQGCFKPGETKATFGTGAFILTHAGDDPPVSASHLLATVAWQIGGERRYALEGSLFVAGQMIHWLRDELGLIASSGECAALARSVADSGGVQIVPAFAGLGAPHWRPDARGAILGLTLGTGRAHIVRAALEAVANQSAELRRAFADAGVHWSRLRIDGGMAANDFLAQDLADVLGIAVERPANVESSALGAAMLAAIGAGMHSTLEAAGAAMRGTGEAFEPVMEADVRAARLARWDQAVAAVILAG